MLHSYPRANVGAIYHRSAIELFQVAVLTKIGAGGHPMSRIAVTFGLVDTTRNSNKLWPRQIVRKCLTLWRGPFTRPGHPCFLYMMSAAVLASRNYIREVGQGDQSAVLLG